MNWKDWLFFIVVMLLGMWIGDLIAVYIPSVGDPFVASILGAVVTLTPGYILYQKFRKKVE